MTGRDITRNCDDDAWIVYADGWQVAYTQDEALMLGGIYVGRAGRIKSMTQAEMDLCHAFCLAPRIGEILTEEEADDIVGVLACLITANALAPKKHIMRLLGALPASMPTGGYIKTRPCEACGEPGGVDNGAGYLCPSCTLDDAGR